MVACERCSDSSSDHLVEPVWAVAHAGDPGVSLARTPALIRSFPCSRLAGPNWGLIAPAWAGRKCSTEPTSGRLQSVHSDSDVTASAWPLVRHEGISTGCCFPPCGAPSACATVRAARAD